MAYKSGYDSIHMYINEVQSRVVAKSGIPTDRYHLGKIIMSCFQEDPDFVMQIDGANDQSETNGSVLNRTVRCAIALQRLGVQKGDVMILTGPNHLDLCIPHFAALYLGVMVAGVDPTFGVNELKDTFKITKPKIIFCQSEKTEVIEEALKQVEMEAKIVVFNESSDYDTLAELIVDVEDKAVKEFRPTDFDSEETPAYLTSTSGSTGVPKAAILTHKNLCIGSPYVWLGVGPKFPCPTKIVLSFSAIQWLTAGFVNLFSPILKITKLQTSAPLTPELFINLINKYKPTCTITSPWVFQNMLPYSEKCDFSCFDCILMGGSAVSSDLIEKLKMLAKTERVYSLYGMSEICSAGFHNDFPPSKGSSGTARGHFDYRIVDPVTKKDITEANTSGELWLRGPSIFKGYYNNPELTATTLTDDGWLMTGDIFYRDEHWQFYFVDRLKFLLKYKNHQVSPVEVETVIRQHPGVLDVCVLGIPDKECGDLVVACVIPKPGNSFPAQEIKDIVKDSLSDSKQLRGGVVFFKEFPITNSAKVNRKKLQALIQTMERE